MEVYMWLSWMQRSALASLWTIVYTWFTLWIIFETRKSTKQSKDLFEISQQPNIDIYIESDESWHPRVNIVIKNTWYGWAYNIKLDSDKDFNIFDSKDDYTLKNLWYFKNGISYLPPNGSRESFFTMMDTNYEEKVDWKINISVNYTDKYWKIHEWVFLINLDQFENTVHIWEPPLYKISKNIEKISNNINNLSTGFKKLQVITQTKEEKRKEDAKRLKEIKQIREQ